MSNKHLNSVCDNPEGLFFMSRIDLDTPYPKGIFNPWCKYPYDWFRTLKPISNNTKHINKFLYPSISFYERYKKGIIVLIIPYE